MIEDQDRLAFEAVISRQQESEEQRWEQENSVLSEKYGTENHSSRIRPAYLALLVSVGIWAILLYIALTDARVPAARKPILVQVSIALMVISFLLMLAPKSWLRFIAEIFGGSKPIESILHGECEVVSNWFVVKQVAIVGILAPLALGGLHFCQNGSVSLGIAMILAAAIGGVLNFGLTIFKPANDFAMKIAQAVIPQGYVDGHKEAVTPFLKQSFLRADISFEVSDFWASTISGNPAVAWGRFSTAGDSLTAGVFCMAEYQGPFDRLKLAETIREISSVHFDKETQSLFGTFNKSENSNLSMMAGLPWQLLYSTLICRMDHDVLATTNKLEAIDDEFIGQMVECWSLLSQQLADDDA